MNDVDEKVDCNVNESKYLPGPGLSLFIQHFITLPGTYTLHAMQSFT